MQEIKVEGKTVEEAVQKAAELLKTVPENLKVKIIDKGSYGLLGITKRPVVITARVEEGTQETGAVLEQSSFEEKETGDSLMEELRQGLVWIENGKVFTDAEENPAYIVIGNHFEVLVNGQLVSNGEVAIRKNDNVEVKPKVEKKEGEWSLKIAPDGLTAKVVIKPGYSRSWKLKDHPPTSRLVLTGDLVEIPIPTLDREMLEKELQHNNVTYGLDEEAIQKACSATQNMEVVIARGLEPQPGEDARVELLFSTEEATRVEVNDWEKVNYREMVVRTSVSTGDLLAVKVPFREGIPGKSVTGQPIDPPKPKDVELVAGRGTEVINGERCVAKIEGRPQARRFQSKVIIDILPVLIQNGDVDLASGNLKFKGSIKITGNITETMQVVATQDVEVAGDVAEATVSAGGSIVIYNNCIGSDLKAGGLYSYYRQLEPVLDEMAQQFEQLCAAIRQLYKESNQRAKLPSSMNVGYIISILLDKRFPSIYSLVNEFVNVTSGIHGEDTEIQKIIKLRKNLIEVFKSPVTVKGISMKTLVEIVTALQEMNTFCRELPQNEGNIVVGYCLNSKLQASGFIKVVGKGSINSDIIAGKTVDVQSVFRGGSINAGDNVYVKELGSRGEVKTIIKVAPGKHIKIGKAWPNCILQVGKRIKRIEKEGYKIFAYLNSNDDLVLSSF